MFIGISFLLKKACLQVEIVEIKNKGQLKYIIDFTK